MKPPALVLAAALACVLTPCALPAAAQPDAGKAAVANTPEANAAFLARHARTAGVRLLPAIQYQVIKSGPDAGPHPTRASTIKVRYEGRFLNGQVFNTSADGNSDGIATFALQKLIPGWITVLQQMRPGDVWQVWIPPEFAYGAKGKETVPPQAILVFRIELLEVLETPPTP
jgi:FKBP-type peptidyl-prolyl cis-trans isomerase